MIAKRLFHLCDLQGHVTQLSTYTCLFIDKVHDVSVSVDTRPLDWLIMRGHMAFTDRDYDIMIMVRV